jgi:hypothetical protein
MFLVLLPLQLATQSPAALQSNTIQCNANLPKPNVCLRAAVQVSILNNQFLNWNKIIMEWETSLGIPIATDEVESF